MQKLTPKQRALCEFVRSYTKERGYPPTIREIGTHLGLRSPSTVSFHLKKLREAGVLSLEEGKTRSITLAQDALPPTLERGQVPLVGEVAAGAPILAEECIEDYIPFDTGAHPEDFFALRVRGESMLGAGILPGDLVVVRSQPEANSGEIVVALFEDEATVKTYRVKDGRVWLMPENPEYQPIDGTYAEIIGKVAAVVRRY